MSSEEYLISRGYKKCKKCGYWYRDINDPTTPPGLDKCRCDWTKEDWEDEGNNW